LLHLGKLAVETLAEFAGGLLAHVGGEIKFNLTQQILHRTLEVDFFDFVFVHERECGDFFCFVNNFFSLFEPAENGAIRGGKFDDVLREGSGDNLENVVFHGASLARFPSGFTVFPLRDDDRRPAVVFHEGENDGKIREVKFFFQIFYSITLVVISVVIFRVTRSFSTRKFSTGLPSKAQGAYQPASLSRFATISPTFMVRVAMQ